MELSYQDETGMFDEMRSTLWVLERFAHVRMSNNDWYFCAVRLTLVGCGNALIGDVPQFPLIGIGPAMRELEF